MPLHRSMRSLTTIICCLAFGSMAHAADKLVAGKKLLLKDKPKMVLLSKDMLVVPGLAGSSSDPRCVPDGGSGSGASVTLSNGVDTATLTMPCANWSANGDGTIYKYKDTAGTPKVGKIKDGLLKVVSPGLGGFPVPNGLWTVTAEVTVGSDKYCMSFIGDGDGTKYVVKDSVAPASCAAPPPPSCGNNVREGQEECDGTADANCVGACDSMCRCNIPDCVGGGECPSPRTCVSNLCVWIESNTPCMPPYTVPSDVPGICAHLCGDAPACGGPCGIGQTCVDIGFANCLCG